MRRNVIASLLGALALLLAMGAGTAAAASPGVQVVGQSAGSAQQATSASGATQIAPSNSNISVRVLSPGNDGAVTQTNSASSDASSTNSNSTSQDADQSQSGGGIQTADQTAQPIQIVNRGTGDLVVNAISPALAAPGIAVRIRLPNGSDLAAEVTISRSQFDQEGSRLNA